MKTGISIQHYYNFNNFRFSLHCCQLKTNLHSVTIAPQPHSNNYYNISNSWSISVTI